MIYFAKTICTQSTKGKKLNTNNFFQSCLFIAVLLTTTLLSQTATPPSTGDGTISSPYQISSIENIQWIAQTPSVWKSHFIQICDIDASVTKQWRRETGSGYYETFSGLRPIGIDSAFSGTYDGNGYVIDSMYQYLENSTMTGLALFSLISGATIKNLKITNAIISSYYYTTSILIANASNSTINNCTVSGTVYGRIDVTGGLIGRSINSIISNCHSTATVSGGNGTGGLIGTFSKGSLEKSSCMAQVKGVMETGGLVGNVGSGSVIRNCFHQGTVRGNYSAGALFGVIFSNVTVKHCYNSGLTLDESMYDTSGLFGNWDTTGTVLESIHWDATVAHLPKSYQGSNNPGNTTSEMYQQATYTGWDFDSVWTIEEGVGYPQLRQNSGVMNIQQKRSSPAVVPFTIVIQNNRLLITEKLYCQVTIMNLQGKTCINEQATELPLYGLPNGHYIAIVKEMKNATYTLREMIVPFTLLR